MVGKIGRFVVRGKFFQRLTPGEGMNLFSEMLVRDGVQADCVIFDPPFSPRQIKECYDSIGKKMGQTDTKYRLLGRTYNA